MQYSRIYFNIAQGRRFSGTIGMQHATQFGGTWHQYRQGEEWSVIHNPVHFKDFINAFFPWSGGSSQVQGETDYFNGNHLGSWDLRLNYAIDDAKTLSVYLQSPWEDGSGIGKLNGFDGVWGICYLSGTQPAVSQIVVEYVDLTNQSGPSHWAPGDYDDSDIPGQATGADVTTTITCMTDGPITVWPSALHLSKARCIIQTAICGLLTTGCAAST